MKSEDNTTTKIVIIGGGISGLSAAYYLSNLTEDEIILLEKNSRFGGRIATFSHNGMEADFGGKYILESNSNILELCDELGISVSKHSSERVIIGNNSSQPVPSSSTPTLTKFKLYLKLLFKYNLSLFKLYQRLSRDRKQLNRFYEILEFQQNMPTAMDEFNEYLEKNAREYLIDNGINDSLVDDFFNPLQRGIYMQDMEELSAIFVFLLLGAFDYDLLTVDDNNKVLIDRLVNHIKDEVQLQKSIEVTKIINKKNTFSVVTGQKTIENVDHIYVATTYAAATNIVYDGFDEEFDNYIEMMKSISYNSNTFKHFIRGIPRSKYLKHLEEEKSLHINQEDNIFLIDKLSSSEHNSTHHEDSGKYLVTAVAEEIDLDTYFTDWKYLASPINWKMAYPDYSNENWKRLDQIKRFENQNQDSLFSNIMISSNTYITTIETGVIKAKKFINQILV